MDLFDDFFVLYDLNHLKTRMINFLLGIYAITSDHVCFEKKLQSRKLKMGRYSRLFGTVTLCFFPPYVSRTWESLIGATVIHQCLQSGIFPSSFVYFIFFPCSCF